MNTLHTAVISGAKKPELSKAILALTDDAKKHFQSEEKYMNSIHFPDLIHHRQLHEVLIEKLVRFRDEFERGNGEINPAFLTFLKVWFTQHIHDADQKYSKFSQGLQWAK